jgi:hypothetical protein
MNGTGSTLSWDWKRACQAKHNESRLSSMNGEVSTLPCNWIRTEKKRSTLHMKHVIEMKTELKQTHS